MSSGHGPSVMPRRLSGCTRNFRVPAAKFQVLAHQLLRSGTSVAAHVREASRARSDAEFCSKLEGALQEADESQLWLELLREDCGIKNMAVGELLDETDELIAIFVTIATKTRTHI